MINGINPGLGHAQGCTEVFLGLIILAEEQMNIAATLVDFGHLGNQCTWLDTGRQVQADLQGNTIEIQGVAVGKAALGMVTGTHMVVQGVIPVLGLKVVPCQD